MKAGVALVRLLEKYGVDTVFGIPGTHSLELYRGLSTGPIRTINPRHEQGGGFMADGYARISGKPGVCFVITGPGVTNMTTPMGEAFMDYVPMLVISPVNTPHPAGENIGRLHEISDQSALTAPLTAFSATAGSSADIPGLIQRAFQVFHSGPPQPVHISIPLSVLDQDVDSEWETTALPARPAATDAEIQRMAQLINDARMPVIVAGGGARSAATEVLALAEKISAAVICTVAARGLIDGEHELSPGAQLRAQPVQRLLAEADLAIVLGSELSQTDHWCDELDLPDRQIRVNLNLQTLISVSDGIVVQADVKDTAARMSSACNPAPGKRREFARQACERARARLAYIISAKEQVHLAVLRRLMQELPDDTIFVSDMTQIAYTAIDLLPLKQTQQWLHPTGFGTLGYGLPAGIGAKLAAPSRKVVILAGDAGLQYTGQEMTLAAELGQDLILLLWNNDALQQICDDMDNAGIERTGVVQQNPDFMAWARACGWEAETVNDYDNLANSLRSALTRSKRPVMIQINEKNLS